MQNSQLLLLLTDYREFYSNALYVKSTEFSHIHAKQSFQRKATSFEWPNQLATRV